MSETVHYIGKLKPTGKTVSDYIDYKIPENYTLKEFFDEKYYKAAYAIDDQVFEVEKAEFDDCDDILIASKNDDGSIDFQVKYYNGGCSFSEALDCAIKQL